MDWPTIKLRPLILIYYIYKTGGIVGKLYEYVTDAKLRNIPIFILTKITALIHWIKEKHIYLYVRTIKFNRLKLCN